MDTKTIYRLAEEKGATTSCHDHPTAFAPARQPAWFSVLSAVLLSAFGISPFSHPKASHTPAYACQGGHQRRLLSMYCLSRDSQVSMASSHHSSGMLMDFAKGFRSLICPIWYSEIQPCAPRSGIWPKLGKLAHLVEGSFNQQNQRQDPRHPPAETKQHLTLVKLKSNPLEIPWGQAFAVV